MSKLEMIYQLSLETPNRYFIFAMILLIVLALTPAFAKLKNHTPALLTSLGIMGTFFGISYALVDFDPSDVNASIPKLLIGMKTKFFVSLVGVFLSFIFKICAIFSAKTEKVVKKTTLDDIAVILEGLKPKPLPDNTPVLTEALGGLGAEFSKLSQVVREKSFQVTIPEPKLPDDGVNQSTQAITKLVGWLEANREENTNVLNFLKETHTNLFQEFKSLGDKLEGLKPQVTPDHVHLPVPVPEPKLPDDSVNQASQAITKLTSWLDVNKDETSSILSYMYDRNKADMNSLFAALEQTQTLNSQTTKTIEECRQTLEKIARLGEVLIERDIVAKKKVG